MPTHNPFYRLAARCFHYTMNFIVMLIVVPVGILFFAFLGFLFVILYPFVAIAAVRSRRKFLQKLRAANRLTDFSAATAQATQGFALLLLEFHEQGPGDLWCIDRAALASFPDCPLPILDATVDQALIEEIRSDASRTWCTTHLRKLRASTRLVPLSTSDRRRLVKSPPCEIRIAWSDDCDALSKT